jgi:hypothetical protein
LSPGLTLVRRNDEANIQEENEMKYALLVYSQPGSHEALSEAEYEKVMGEYGAISQLPEVLGGEQLQPVETATTVRVQGEQSLTTDGPFADTKEVFGGFYLLDADNIDTAIQVASRIPAARLGGSVEVRPIVER